MRIRFVATSAFAVLLTACGGGDINISPVTNDSSVNNSNNTTTGGTNTGNNPCAFFVRDTGQTVQGTFNDPNCEYAAQFASAGNEVNSNITVPALSNNGAHIFESDLIIGQSFTSDADLAAAGITQGGDGPILTIEAGATLAWPQGRSMIINRGAQLFAVGNASAPITLTSETDVNGDLAADPEAVEQWGGLIINGFGVTNECAYTPGTVRGVDLTLASECHVVTEGITGAAENRHGGNNDADNSGRMEFLIVKHTGGDLGAGNDLNGITFASVGSGTVIENLQTYSTLDDGIEFFGGAVDVTNFAGIYNRDDTIDIDAGYIGTIQTALVIQSELQGNHCIEADGIDDHDSRTADPAVEPALVAAGLVSAPTIRNLTCIISPSATASQDPGAGWRLREGIRPTIVDSMVIGTFLAPAGGANDNYCLRIEDGTETALATPEVTLDGILMACALPVRSVAQADAETEGVVFQAVDTMVNAGVLDPTATADAGFVILEGTPPIFSVPTATAQVNGAAAVFADTTSAFIGTFRTTDTNVFAGWTFGIFDDNRGQPLYFE